VYAEEQAGRAGISTRRRFRVASEKRVYRFFSPIKPTEFVELSNQVVPVLGTNSRNQLTYAGHDLSRVDTQASRDRLPRHSLAKKLRQSHLLPGEALAVCHDCHL
jgi:hypothetical protein